ncbi:MAG: nucleotidyltransferase domain-containing protein [Nitriliruptorales bacterium]|nr:nucleotidyltransferase domain-containing protein [Nitriliruptorales bacterium]
MSAPPTPAEVVARRLTERAQLLEEAKAFALGLDPGLEVRWVCVFGSVARGDFNAYSDIDVLVVAEGFPQRYQDRLEALGWPTPGRVEPVAWTSMEYRSRLQRQDAIALEALESGVCLVGEPPAGAS